MNKLAILALFIAIGVLSAPASYAEEAVAPAVVEATPSTDAVEGAIKSVDLESETPSFMLTLADGTEAAVQIDEAETQVTNAGAPSDVMALAAGQKVSVRKADRDGKAVAKTIDILA
ncbi:MAG TPA: hypothetical protein VL404_09780 [Candidatus Eisenbacteria bacterium]|jgi:hypothetical protein|nr:hypothetical protein [Candidatus Eisenbacteria bacterium]